MSSNSRGAMMSLASDVTNFRISCTRRHSIHLRLPDL